MSLSINPISDPSISQIWEKFGHGSYQDILIDDDEYFDNLLNHHKIFKNIYLRKIIKSRPVRILLIGFPALELALLDQFMKIWKYFATEKKTYRDPCPNSISGLSMIEFISYLAIRSILKLPFIRNKNDTSIYGIQITKNRNRQNNKKEPSIQKFDLKRMSIKNAWEFFGQKDKILIIQKLQD